MRENKIKIIIIILVICIFIVAIGGTALYLTTDLFKSSQLLFQKYIAQNIQNIVDVIDVSQDERMADALRKSNYVETSDGTIKYLEKENDEEEVYTIKEKGVNKASEQATYKNISASYGDNLLLSVDLLGQNNVYGIRLANLVQQFVSTENKSVSYFVSSLGLDGSMFTESLQGVDVTGLLDFTDEDVQTLTKNYVTLILQDIDKTHYSSKKKTMITLSNKESVTTNAYTLTVTKNELDKLYKKILNQAMNDKIIVGKIENTDAKIKEAGFAEPEGKSIKEQYMAKIQEKIDSLEYQGEDLRQATITVYEKDGVTVRTALKTEEEEYVLDLDDTKGKILNLKTSKLVDQTEETKTYEVGQINDETGNTKKVAYGTQEESYDVEISTTQADSGMTIGTKVNYKSQEINNLDFALNTDIKMAVDEEIPVNFDDTNNILLNNYDGVRVLSILNNLKGRLIKSLESSQSIINTKLLNKIILKIDENEQQQKQEEQDSQELQKEKFNNKFILYEGENVEKEYVKKLINTASQNMTDYQVISGSQIKIFIKEGSKEEQKAKEIETAIDASNDTYNIKLNYNNEGYVDSIDLTVYKKK